MNIETANKTVHPVEEQWHYPILTKYGFVPNTKEGVGFVRSYEYEHPNGRKVRCITGLSCDYWSDQENTGFWSDLEKWLKSLEG